MKVKKSLTEQMGRIGLAINGTLDNPLILSKTSLFGYTEEVVREGRSKYDSAQTAILAHQKEYGEQYTAYETRGSLWSQSYETYGNILTLCRVGLKDKPGVLHSLRATGTRNRSLTGFIKDARMLYTNLLSQPEYLAIMARFCVTAELLENANAEIDALEKASQAYFREKGEAQDMTIKRDQLFDNLYNWYSDFRAVLRLALTDSPQLLEKLGIIVKR